MNANKQLTWFEPLCPILFIKLLMATRNEQY